MFHTDMVLLHIQVLLSLQETLFLLHARTMFLQMRAYIVHFLVNWLLLLRPWNWMMVYDGDNFEQVSPVMFLSFTICWEIHFCHFFVCLLAWMLRLSSVFFTQRPANMNIQCGDSSQLEILFFYVTIRMKTGYVFWLLDAPFIGRSSCNWMN